MTFEERNQVLASASFISKCRIALCDWMQYWVINGVSSIQDETLRNQTDAFIRYAMDNLDNCTSKIAILAISDSNVANAAEITDTVIQSAVTNIMTNALNYLM